MTKNVIEIDHGWKKWVEGYIKAEDGMGVAVGIMESSAPRKEGEMDNATLAAIHEFGKGVVPERSFMRSTLDENKAEIKKREAELGMHLDATLKGDLMLLGEFLKKKILDKINARIPPALEAATKARKKRYKDIPLKDTVQMVRAIHSTVVEGAELKRLMGSEGRI